MLSWSVAIVLNCVSLELFMRLPMVRLVVLMARRVARARRVMVSARISPHWKEKVMPMYTARLARLTLALSAGFGLVIMAFLAVLSLAGPIGPHVEALLMRPAGLAAGGASALLYLAARQQLARA